MVPLQRLIRVLLLVSILSTSLVNLSQSRPLSKVFETLESLWRQSWAGFEDFPNNFPHLYGAHINTHKWKESGPVHLGLPIEGILERKDHPYHSYVKMKYGSSPIGTHIVGDKDKVSEDVVALHRFIQDRHYGIRQEMLKGESLEPEILSSNVLTSNPTSTTTESNERSSQGVTTTTANPSSASEGYVPADILAKYFASDSNTQVLHPLLDPANFVDVYHNMQRPDGRSYAESVTHTMHPIGVPYPGRHSPDYGPEPSPDMTALYIAMHPLPVFTPIGDKSSSESNDREVGVVEEDNHSNHTLYSYNEERANSSTTSKTILKPSPVKPPESSKSWITRHADHKDSHRSDETVDTKASKTKSPLQNLKPKIKRKIIVPVTRTATRTATRKQPKQTAE